MTIEIRNFTPIDVAANVSIYTDLMFNIVALNDYTIDIASLQIDITQSSNIDDSENVLSFTATSPEVDYRGNSRSYTVSVNPAPSYDYGLDISIAINIDGEDDVSVAFTMDEFTSTFTTVNTGIISVFRNSFIYSTERIPVYQEILRKNSTTAPTIFDSAFNRWNNDHLTKIELNEIQKEIDDEINPYTIDYQNGKIKFDEAVTYNDQVAASYTFQFFTDEQIQAYFDIANAQWNIYPPSGGSLNIYNAGSTQGIIMIGAALLAFRELLLSLAVQGKRIVFDHSSDGTGWTSVKDIFQSEHDMLKDDWSNVIDAKKRNLPNIASVVSPSFSLPGGRCLYSQTTCQIDYNQFVNFDTMYNMMLEKRPIKVAVKDKNGDIKFSKVSCIEYNGKKEVYGVGISNGLGYNMKNNISYTSIDHKYDTDYGMRRLKDLSIGDRIYMKNEDKTVKGKIEEIGRLGMEDCYDIEVPETGKFFCSSASVSNSRMFRYLYKSPVQ